MKTETLIRALDRFGEFTDDEVVTKGIIEYEDDESITLSFRQTCRLASVWISQRDEDAIKYRLLKDGMKKQGLKNLYELILNEPLT